MTEDILIVAGALAVAASAFPLLNGFSRGEMPRSWAVLCLGGMGLVTAVMAANPNTYNFANLPDVFVRVISTTL